MTAGSVHSYVPSLQGSGIDRMTIEFDGRRWVGALLREAPLGAAVSCLSSLTAGAKGQELQSVDAGMPTDWRPARVTDAEPQSVSSLCRPSQYLVHSADRGYNAIEFDHAANVWVSQVRLPESMALRAHQSGPASSPALAPSACCATKVLERPVGGDNNCRLQSTLGHTSSQLLTPLVLLLPAAAGDHPEQRERAHHALGGPRLGSG